MAFIALLIAAATGFSLAQLPSLQSLDVSGNRLSGPVPEPLLQRWDDHRFEFSGQRNSFSNLVARASVEYSSLGVLCAEHDDVRFRLDVDETKGRTVFQSVRCADARSRRTYRLVREGTPGSLEVWVAQQLVFRPCA